MQKYTLNQMLKALEKIFKKNITTAEQFKAIKWDKLDEIDKNLTPVEKSFIMDFRNAVLKRKIVEFLAGKEIEEEKKKDD